MNLKYCRILLLAVAILTVNVNTDSAQSSGTFINPLFQSGADPWIIFKDSLFYYTSTSGSNLFICKGKNLNELRTSGKKVIWTPPQGTSYSREIWAPELHFIDGKWYMYFAADDGKNRNHRMYVVENASADPLSGTWEFKGKVADPSDKWAIDGSVFTYKGKLYMIWSGWEGDVNGQQNIYIARMKNPWTIDGKRVLISAPEYDWERVGDLNNKDDVPHVNVNEGPVALQKNGRLFIIYSASGCWTENYCLGMLAFKGGRKLLDPLSWRKNPVPVFKAKPEASVYAPGHNSFFTSPDGREDWILYHANPAAGQGCGRFRTPRAQNFGWNSDGTPDFGEPQSAGIPVSLPSSGELSKQ
jgi:GH43 family beta-xylosidase